MISNVVTAIAVPIRSDLNARERARDCNGESLLYSKVPHRQILNISAPISVPSITYSLQCARTASARAGDGASGVTGYRRGVDIVSSESPIYAMPDSFGSGPRTTPPHRG